MSKVRNVSGEDRVVPWLGGRVVTADEVVDVPDSDVDAYTVQTGVWETADVRPPRRDRGSE